MIRRSFLRFLALSPLAALAASQSARGQIAARTTRPVGARGYSLAFKADELHEFSVVRVPLERATWIMNPDAIRQLEALPPSRSAA